MKKVTIVLIGMILSLSVSVQAQHIFNIGSLMFNAGIGGLSVDGWIPSINFSGEYGVIPTGDVGLVSFGGIVAYKYSTWAATNITYDYNYHQFVMGPRASWHVHAFESDKWDAYGGVGGGIRIWTQYQWDPHSTNYTHKGKVSPYGEVFVGGRMMFKEKFGLFAEVGYGTLSAIKFGVTFGM